MTHVGIDIPDDILPNILSRLPGKCLVRFTCVSKHWKRLITDPDFMKSRSRRMILLSTATSLIHLPDHTLPEQLHHSEVSLSPPDEQEQGTEITVVGTFNGIVLLLLTNPNPNPNPNPTKRHCCLHSPQTTTTTGRMIIYNPLTRASKDIPNPPYNDATTRVIGFGYGATPDDFKIVTIDVKKTCNCEWSVCNVFDLKTNSRSAQFGVLPAYSFHDHMEGTFVNGFLYWVAYYGRKKFIFAVNVKDMTISKIDLPQCNFMVHSLGSIDGCLCLINTTDYTGFDVWMVKEEEEEGVIKNSWSKVFSSTFGLEGSRLNVFYPVCILDHGRILMRDGSTGLIIYDISKHSSESLVSVRAKDFEIECGIECVESFVSPSDMC